MFQEHFKRGSRVFQERLKGISREIWVSRVFERNSKVILGKFQSFAKGVSRKSQACSKKVFRMLQGNFKVVSRKIEGVSMEF